MSYNDPQALYYPGHYGRNPHTEIAPGVGILWDAECKRIPAKYVDNLLLDGFRLALTTSEAAERYDVPQYVIKALVDDGELQTCQHEDGAEYVVYDIKTRKRATAEAERRRELRNTSSTDTTEEQS